MGNVNGISMDDVNGIRVGNANGFTMGHMMGIPIPARLANEPPCAKCMGLGELQTPFSWYSPVLSHVDCEMVEEKLCLLGSPWATLVNRLQIAYGFFCNEKYSRGRALLVECYLPLLPIADSGCGIINGHKEALRHVLDSSWAAMDRVEMLERELQRQNSGKGGCKLPSAAFKACLRNITPYSKLSRKQQAAVCAIKGSLSSDPEYLRKAVSLNPAEGEWHHKLGALLEEKRGVAGMSGKSLPSAEELKALRTGYRLRPGPDSTTRLARALLFTGPEGRAEANKLMQEALTKYPDHPRVLFVAGCLSGPLQQCSSAEACRLALKMYKRCDELLGGRCISVLLRQAIVYKHMGCKRQADAYLDRAASINEGVLEALANELNMAEGDEDSD